MYHEAYHQEAQRRQRVIERKHLALERLKEKYTRQVSLNFTLRFRGLVILFIVKSNFFSQFEDNSGDAILFSRDVILFTRFGLKCYATANKSSVLKMSMFTKSKQGREIMGQTGINCTEALKEGK